MSDRPFSEAEIERYARHIVLPEVGGIGQARLGRARVLVIGAGGLGAPLIQYLAAAGVAAIGIVDHDRVDLSNLQRQVIHGTGDIGRPKVESAAEAARAINPLVAIEPHRARLDAGNALDLIGRYDIVADGTDSFEARYLIADACHLAGRPLVSAALYRFDGQVMAFRSHERDGTPCYRCLYPTAPPAGTVPSCAEGGVFGAVAGVVGTLQATEVLKLALGIGRPLVGRLLLYDGLEATTETIAVPRDPACRLCGDTPAIHDLSHHLAASAA